MTVPHRRVAEATQQVRPSALTRPRVARLQAGTQVRARLAELRAGVPGWLPAGLTAALPADVPDRTKDALRETVARVLGVALYGPNDELDRQDVAVRVQHWPGGRAARQPAGVLCRTQVGKAWCSPPLWSG